MSLQSRMEGCTNWCEWVPVLGWKYVEECRLCINATVIITNVTASEKPRPRGLKTKQLSGMFPDWCRWLPAASLKFVADCAGYGSYGGSSRDPASVAGPDCASWCQWVPQLAWADPPDCRACGTVESSSDSSDTASVPTVPIWCSWVPPLALKYVDACTGSNGALPAQAEGCTYWCVWVSGPAWHHVHECHGCSSVENATNATDNSSLEEADVVKPADLSGIGFVGSGLKVKTSLKAIGPDWCRWVPAGSLQYVPDCTGYDGGYGYGVGSPSAARGQCESWCQWVPQPAWQYPPGCRGC